MSYVTMDQLKRNSDELKAVVYSLLINSFDSVSRLGNDCPMVWMWLDTFTVSISIGLHIWLRKQSKDNELSKSVTECVCRILDNMPVTWCYEVEGSDGQLYCNLGFPIGCYVTPNGVKKDACTMQVPTWQTAACWLCSAYLLYANRKLLSFVSVNCSQ